MHTVMHVQVYHASPYYLRHRVPLDVLTCKLLRLRLLRAWIHDLDDRILDGN